MEETAYCSGKDVLWAADGTVYHLGVKKGDIFPRILQVGCYVRAELYKKFLDEGTVTRHESPRRFVIYSGKYNGVGVSIIATGMGAPNMDFMVREASYICSEPLAIIRVGTCGLINPTMPPGSVVVADRSSFIFQNYCYWDGCQNWPELEGKDALPYIMTKPVDSHAPLSDLLFNCLKQENGENTHRGLHCAADTFYSCQGRVDGIFEDKNSDILPMLKGIKVDTVEMETHCLFHLGNRRKGKCFTAACHIGVLNRTNQEFGGNVSSSKFDACLEQAGKSALNALVQFNLP